MPPRQATTKTSTRAAKATESTSPSTAVELVPATPAPFDREQAVREAAYARFEARGCVPGYELEDWLHAEATVPQALGTADTPSSTGSVAA